MGRETKGLGCSGRTSWGWTGSSFVGGLAWLLVSAGFGVDSLLFGLERGWNGKIMKT